VHLLVRPGGAVSGEHVHPFVDERFTVVRDHLEARVGGKRLTLGPGDPTFAVAGVPHAWWNASETEDAHVLVEVAEAPGAVRNDLGRFELMIANLFGLANDGKLNRKNRPRLLQAAVLQPRNVLAHVTAAILIAGLGLIVLAGPGVGAAEGHDAPDDVVDEGR
jgi:hypothetical protein